MPGKLFRLSLKEIDRNTTKKQWKAINQWLRKCDRELNKHNNKIMASMSELMVYGSTTLEI